MLTLLTLILFGELQSQTYSGFDTSVSSGCYVTHDRHSHWSPVPISIRNQAVHDYCVDIK